MASRVFWKGLILVVKNLIRYIQRNQLGLENNLDSTQYSCVTALLDAALICVEALPENTPTV